MKKKLYWQYDATKSFWVHITMFRSNKTFRIFFHINTQAPQFPKFGDARGN